MQIISIFIVSPLPPSFINNYNVGSINVVTPENGVNNRTRWDIGGYGNSINEINTAMDSESIIRKFPANSVTVLRIPQK